MADHTIRAGLAMISMVVSIVTTSVPGVDCATEDCLVLVAAKRRLELGPNMIPTAPIMDLCICTQPAKLASE